MSASTRQKTAPDAIKSASKRLGKNTSENKRGKGRPPLLQLDDETIRKIENLARIQCTEEEAAAVLNVSQPTLNRFLNNNEKAMEAWQNGAKSGRASVRRWQFKAAEGGNVSMQIWLGKQLLAQRDKFEHTGGDGGPIKHQVGVSWMTEAQAKARGWA